MSVAVAPYTTNATGDATGLNADRVDGKEAADFAAAADVTALQGSLLFAVVADTGAGDNATLGGNRGATAVTENGDDYVVTFNRDVSKCSFTATATGNSNGDAIPLAAAPVSSQANQASVTASAGDPSFNLQVIC